MKVLTLVPYQKGYAPGQRGSIELWEQILKAQGIELSYEVFESDKLREILYKSGQHFAKASEMIKSYFQRLNLLKNLDEYDAVFVYREAALLGPAFLEKLIARKKPIIYQLDDPLFAPYKSPSNGLFSYLKFFGKVKEIIRISRVVIANSSHIRDYALQFNKNVWQIPSIVDTNIFRYEPFPENIANPKIGWSGSPTTLGNLKLIEKPLQELSKKGNEFFFIGGDSFDLQNVNYQAKKWNGETEVEDLRRMQIGLVPLPDNEWNKYKFIMKTAQYMSLGIVPVGTPMASNTEVIRHGENGFLAGNDKEWIEYLTVLTENSELRNKMSQAAAKDAEEKYSLNANAAKVIEAFRAAIRD